MAKSVVLEDDNGYILAVLPASYRVDLGELHRLTSRSLGLATESELGALFEDCETNVAATPTDFTPVGGAQVDIFDLGTGPSVTINMSLDAACELITPPKVRV